MSDDRRCVIYARVSSERQEQEGYSIPAQVRFLRGYARERGLEIVAEYTASESAASPGRAVFGEVVVLTVGARHYGRPRSRCAWP